MSKNNYIPLLGEIETQEAISFCKRCFEKYLCKELQLTHIQAPRYVRTNSGLQDGLDGTIESIKFRPLHLNYDVEIVHSLAKWKRYTLWKYDFEVHKGICTNMEAIRKDDILDDVHSFFVDQWDWEMVISKDDRNTVFLEFVVNKIYKALRRTQLDLFKRFMELKPEHVETTIYGESDLKKNSNKSMNINMTGDERENEKLRYCNKSENGVSDIEKDAKSDEVLSTNISEDMSFERADFKSSSATGTENNLFQDTGIDDELFITKEEKKYSTLEHDYLLLPEKLHFLHSEDLLGRYPHCTTSLERETEAAKEFGAYFLRGIGGKLKDGKPHDIRAFDYDDYSTIDKGFMGLNGDIIVYDPVRKKAIELSSMGIRVDAQALKFQACEVATSGNGGELQNSSEISKTMHGMLDSPFHQRILDGTFPLTIGGGIGVSRVCMFLLRKMHIGEVQASEWPLEMVEEYKKKGCLIL